MNHIILNGNPKVELDVQHWLDQAMTHILNGKSGTLEVSFLSKPAMTELNAQVLSHHYPTDIITFDLSDSFGWGADLYVCMPVIRANAKRWGNTVVYELKFVLVHGLLHTLGYSDDTEAGRQQMYLAQDALIRAIP